MNEDKIITEIKFWELVAKLVADRTAYVYEQEFKVAEYIQDVQKVMRYLIEMIDTTKYQYMKTALSILLTLNFVELVTIGYLIYLLTQN